MLIVLPVHRLIGWRLTTGRTQSARAAVPPPERLPAHRRPRGDAALRRAARPLLPAPDRHPSGRDGHLACQAGESPRLELRAAWSVPGTGATATHTARPRHYHYHHRGITARSERICGLCGWPALDGRDRCLRGLAPVRPGRGAPYAGGTRPPTAQRCVVVLERAGCGRERCCERVC
jgi:hypothetical protein